MLLENVQGGRRLVLNLWHKYEESLHKTTLIIIALTFLTIKSAENNTLRSLLVMLKLHLKIFPEEILTRLFCYLRKIGLYFWHCFISFIKITMSSVTCLAMPYFQILSHNDTIFFKSTEYKMRVPLFATYFVRIVYYKKSWARHYHNCTNVCI